MDRKTVTMLVDQRGSEDGHTIQMFKKDEVYDMEMSLALAFIDEKWAKPGGKLKAATKAVKEKLENKQLDGAPENKAADGEGGEPDAGEDGGEAEGDEEPEGEDTDPDGEPDPDMKDDYPPLSYAKHTSFGRWYVFSEDGKKLSGPHKKQEVIDKGFET